MIVIYFQALLKIYYRYIIKFLKKINFCKKLFTSNFIKNLEHKLISKRNKIEKKKAFIKGIFIEITISNKIHNRSNQKRRIQLKITLILQQ